MKKKVFFILLIFCFIFGVMYQPILSSAATTDGNSWVYLNDYQEVLQIHDTYQLYAFACGKGSLSWKSSNSKVASVNKYGLVTAKKAGTAKIIATVRNAKAACDITVQKTTITLNKSDVTLEHGQSVQLTAKVSNQTTPIYRSNRPSIAKIDEIGKITAMKPGTATITVKADGTTETCKVTVKKPKIQISKNQVTLYRTQKVKLSAAVSSGLQPVWKSSSPSVASVDNNGQVTALKHGTTTIIVSLDGVKKTCKVIVKQPTIQLSDTSIQLKKGASKQLTATVSSGNAVVWNSSNSDVVYVSSKGKIKAKKKGRATIYAKEDGVKVSCKVVVTES